MPKRKRRRLSIDKPAVESRFDLSAQKRFIALVILLLVGIICTNLIFPLLALFRKAVDFEPFYQGFISTLSSRSTLTSLWNSVKVSFVSTIISIVAAFFFGYIIEFKLSQKLKRVFRFFSILPMLVPSITHGIVIVYLFGRQGIVTHLLGVQLPIYGPLGIVLGSFFYSFSLAFLVFSQAFINLDGRLFENAQVLGVKPFRRFFSIVLPLMRYAVFSAFVVCFTMIFTDYGVPLSVGGTYPILPLQFYKNVIGLLDFSTGAIYGILILLPTVILYFFDIFYFSRKQHTSKTNVIEVRTGRFHPAQVVFFAAGCMIISVVVAIVIITPFIRAWPYDTSLTLAHFERFAKAGALRRLIANSVIISLATGLFGSVVSLFAGYMYVRDPNGLKPGKQLMHGLYMTALAIPGLALGLSYALFFRRTFFYNTIALMVIVNVIHFLGSPYMMAVSHFKMLNPNLEAICRTLGGNYFHVFIDVIIPNSKKMLLDIFVYFFTNTMVTISAISMLYSSRSMTLSLQITAYNGQGMLESALAVSLIILLINVCMKALQSFKLDKAGDKASTFFVEEE